MLVLFQYLYLIKLNSICISLFLCLVLFVYIIFKQFVC